MKKIINHFPLNQKLFYYSGKFFTGFVIFIVLWFIPVSSWGYYGGGKGVYYFRKAYKMEKEKPRKAIYFYERALKYRLRSVMKKTALWRLFYLYLNQKEFNQAVKIFENLGGEKKLEKIQDKLIKELTEYYAISIPDAKKYLTGMANLSDFQCRKYRTNLEPFKLILSVNHNNWILFRDIIKALENYCCYKNAIYLVNNIPEKRVEHEFMAIDLFIHWNRRRTAYKRLLSLRHAIVENDKKYFYDKKFLRSLKKKSEFPVLENGQRGLFHYFLGHYYKKRWKNYQAAIQFLLASKYVDKVEANRFRSIAALCLYKAKELDLAFGVISRLGEMDHKNTDKNIYLLKLLLNWEFYLHKPSAKLIKKIYRSQDKEKYSKYLLKKAGIAIYRMRWLLK